MEILWIIPWFHYCHPLIEEKKKSSEFLVVANSVGSCWVLLLLCLVLLCKKYDDPVKKHHQQPNTMEGSVTSDISTSLDASMSLVQRDKNHG